MKSTYILDYLGIRHDNLEFGLDIDSVSQPKPGVNNSLMFINRQYDMSFLNACSNCMILMDKSLMIEPFNIKGTNLVVGNIVDSRYWFAKIILTTGLTKVYGLPTFTDYGVILDTSKIISKTAKIYNSVIGSSCSFHHNVLIGVDDFCPLRSPDGKDTILFPQLGYTVLGNNVSVFSNSIVSRGALWSTEVGDDTQIDAFCQIGHNCKIGKQCMITAGVIIAGSTTIGDNVFIGIGSKIRNGLKIGNNVTIAQGSNVVKDIPDNVIVMGNPAKVVGYNQDFNATNVPK